MSEAKVGRRRGHGEDAVHLDAARGWYVGAASLGLGPDGRRVRRKVSGKTKQEVPGQSQGAAPGTRRGSEVLEHAHEKVSISVPRGRELGAWALADYRAADISFVIQAAIVCACFSQPSIRDMYLITCI